MVLPTTSNTAVTQQIVLEPRRITVRLLYLLTVMAFLSLSGVIALYDNFFIDYRHLVNMDDGYSIPTMVASALLFVAAVLSGLIAYEHRKKGKPYGIHWYLLSFIFLIMSIAEISQLYEALNQINRLFNLGRQFAPVSSRFSIVFLITFGLVYAPFIWHMPRRTSFWFMIGFGIFFAGAIFLDAYNGRFNRANPQEILAYAFLTTLEESLENLGIIMLIYTLLGYLRHHCDLVIRIVAHDNSTQAEASGKD